MPERGALLGVPVHRAQRRVDIHIHPLGGRIHQHRCAPRQRDQVPASDRGHLLGMPETELAQEDSQRRGRIHLAEHRCRATGTQQVGVIDVITTAQHRPDQ